MLCAVWCACVCLCLCGVHVLCMHGTHRRVQLLDPPRGLRRLEDTTVLQQHFGYPPGGVEHDVFLLARGEARGPRQVKRWRMVARAYESFESFESLREGCECLAYLGLDLDVLAEPPGHSQSRGGDAFQGASSEPIVDVRQDGQRDHFWQSVLGGGGGWSGLSGLSGWSGRLYCPPVFLIFGLSRTEHVPECSRTEHVPEGGPLVRGGTREAEGAAGQRGAREAEWACWTEVGPVKLSGPAGQRWGP